MKQLRQRAIRDLVEQRPIRTQQELAAALREALYRSADEGRTVAVPPAGETAAAASA